MSTLTARGEAERTRAVGAYIAKRTWGSSSVQLKHRHPTERIASTEPNQDRPDTKSKHKSFAQPTKGSSSGLSLCCFHSDGSPLRKIFFGPVGGACSLREPPLHPQLPLSPTICWHPVRPVLRTKTLTPRRTRHASRCCCCGCIFH